MSRLTVALGLIMGLAILAAGNGCSDGSPTAQPQATLPAASTNDPSTLKPVTGEDRMRAYRRVSLIFLNQAPSPQELEAVKTAEGYAAAVDRVLDSEELVAKVRSYHQAFFAMQGTQDGVNFNEPANLAALLFRDNQDFRDILRATFCVDDNLNRIPCSSFSGDENLASQNGAGVVTTQAFLRRWESAFSFRRTNEMLKIFACQEYPDLDDQGLTQAEISESVHTFACVNCNPQCYSCHRTMNPRAALFYRFDTRGVFNMNPTNAQAIKRDDGSRSQLTDLLVEGAQPRFQQKVVNSLREYALEMTRVPKFRRCLAKRLTLLSLGSEQHTLELPGLLKDVDQLLLRHQFRLKDFLHELLRSDEYVLQ